MYDAPLIIAPNSQSSSQIFFVDYGEHDVTGKRMSSHGVPTFHAMGIIVGCWAVRGLRCICYDMALTQR
jgi:hypothetical protein